MGAGLDPTYRLIELRHIDSTNAEALRRIERGEGAGIVIRADRQSSGRGRKGAHWESPAGNLYMSLVVRPPDQSRVGQLSFVAAVAAGQGLTDLAGPLPDLVYKWPNDLMVGSAKLGGILIEGGGQGCYAVGIGINLSQAPTVVGRRTLAVREIKGMDVPPQALLVAICNRFAGWYDQWRSAGFAAVREAWLRRASGIGSPVEARMPAETLRGWFRDIDLEGALVLDLPDGTSRKVTAGAVYFPDSGKRGCC